MIRVLRCRSVRGLSAASAVASLLMVSGTVFAQSQVAMSVIAQSGDSAPGSGGAVFGSLGSVSINASGAVALTSVLSGSGVTTQNARAIYTGYRSGLTLAARADAIAGVPLGQYVSSFGDPIINGSGRVALYADLAGPGVDVTNYRTILTGSAGAIEPLVRLSDLAPGTFDSEVYQTFDALRMNDGGNVVFNGTVNGPSTDISNNAGIWIGDAPTNLSIAARLGDLAPGVGSAVYVGLGVPAINALGQVVYSGILVGGGTSTLNDTAIWRGVPPVLTVALRENNQAAGVATGQRYAGFQTPSTNAAGRIAVAGVLRGTGVNSTNGSAAWLGSTPWTLLIRAGDAAPGVPNGVVTAPGAPRLNAYGSMVLLSALSGTTITTLSDLALWSVNVGQAPRLVFWKGSAAPGLPGLTIGSMNNPAINSSGAVVFSAGLVGPGVVPGVNDTAIYAWDTVGLKLVVRAGGTLPQFPGKTVASVSTLLDTGNQDGKASSLSEKGVLVFVASFTDGSSAALMAQVARCISDVTAVGGGLPDGQVTIEDFLTFLSAFGDSSAVSDIVGAGNEVGPDGLNTIEDFLSLLSAFGDGC